MEIQGIFGELPFGLRHYWKGHFLQELTDGLIGFTADHFAARSSKRGSILIEPLHGMARRVPLDSMAFNQRGAQYNASAISTWEEPAEDASQIRWAREYAAVVQPYSMAGAAYLNYMGYDEPIEKVKAV